MERRASRLQIDSRFWIDRQSKRQRFAESWLQLPDNALPVKLLWGAYDSQRQLPLTRAGSGLSSSASPFHFSHRIQFATRLDDIAAVARADGLPAPSGGRQRLTRHWAHRSQLTGPSRRITPASLPYPLMTVLPWMRLDRVQERVFVCRITLSKAARCRFCPF